RVHPEVEEVHQLNLIVIPDGFLALHNHQLRHGRAGERVEHGDRPAQPRVYGRQWHLHTAPHRPGLVPPPNRHDGRRADEQVGHEVVEQLVDLVLVQLVVDQRRGNGRLALVGLPYKWLHSFWPRRLGQELEVRAYGKEAPDNARPQAVHQLVRARDVQV